MAYTVRLVSTGLSYGGNGIGRAGNECGRRKK